MAQTSENEKQSFNTDHPFAFIGGFLILPAFSTILIFVMSIFIVISSNPGQLDGLSLITYYMHILFIPYLLISMFMWVRRKRLTPKLMAVFFLVQALWSIAYMVYGIENEFMNVAINTIWFLYFLRSSRVKATFTK